MSKTTSSPKLLKEVRKHKTQKEIAQILHIGTKIVSRWGNGHVEPDQIGRLTLKDFIKPEIEVPPINSLPRVTYN